MTKIQMPRLYNIITRTAAVIGLAAGVGIVEYSSYLHDVPLGLERIAADIFYGLAGGGLGIWASNAFYEAHFCKKEKSFDGPDEDGWTTITTRIVDKKTGYVLREEKEGSDGGWID